MKKTILLLLALVTLTACHQKQELGKPNPSKGDNITKVEKNKADKKQEKQKDEEATKESSKLSPADFPRLESSDLEVSKEALKAIKPYVGYYTGSVETSDSEGNDTIKTTVDVVIFDDATINLYMHETQPSGQHSSKLEDQFYLSNDKTIQKTYNLAILETGILDMEYGQVIYEYDTAIEQEFLDENGELLPVFRGNSWGIDQRNINLNNGKIELTFLDSYNNEITVTLTQIEPRIKWLSYTANQIEEYNYKLSSSLYNSKSYQLSLHELFQMFFNDKSGIYKARILPTTDYTGYYTHDNKEIKPEYIIETDYDSDEHTIYAFDGHQFWRLENYNSKKAIKEDISTEPFIYLEEAN